MTNKKKHWEDVYRRTPADRVSWHQVSPRISLEIIDRIGLAADGAVVDIGGGASRLVDELLDMGFEDITVLDIAVEPLELSRRRLGGRADSINWITSDVLDWQPGRRFDFWHDRAVFHFLSTKAERERYAEIVAAAVNPGAWAVVATFAVDGPERCSGLPVTRHDGASIAGIFGNAFRLVDEILEPHRTPAGKIQNFAYFLLERT